MLAYLRVQRYKGTEILKQNHFGIKTYKKQKTETTVWLSWAEASVCVCLLCSVTSVHSRLGFRCSLFVKNLPIFAKCMKWSQKKAANFWGWNAVFCNQRFCNQPMAVLQMLSKGSLRDFCSNEPEHSWCGFASPHSRLISWALNGLTAQPPREPWYSNKIENERHGKLTLPQTSWCFHKVHGSRTPPPITG